MNKIPFTALQKHGRPLYGADYNPEQWYFDRDILEADFEHMRRLGVTSLSIGIFSWTLYEPTEGQYEFAWMDALMDRLAAENITAFLATPSGSKPMWMSERYPEIRRVTEEGRREPSGGRHNHCPTSPFYREKVKAINTQMAKRYGQHPALGLWHVGNELQGECHCSLCRKAFQDWLRERYVTLDELNEAWWGRFWNHSFTDWEQIPTHDESIDGLRLDYLRFINDQHVSFLRDEIEPLREHSPQIPCTTNMMGTYPTANYWQWSKEIDLISNDHYPLPSDREGSWKCSVGSDFIHSLMRGFAEGKTWLQIECSPSSVNWAPINKLKRPGVHEQEMLQAIANGSDGIHYFQWRKGRGGYEKYHGAVLDHEGSDKTRVYQECKRVGELLQGLDDLGGHSTPKAPVALLYDWESRWAFEASVGPKRTRRGESGCVDAYTRTAHAHFRALTRSSVAVDIISREDDFAGRKVVVTPMLYLLEEDLRDRLVDFVRQGGLWVCTAFSGYVDESNRCHLGGFPGPKLREVFGVWNEEMDFLYDDETVSLVPSAGSFYAPHHEGVASDCLEVLHLEGAQSLLNYGSDFHAGKPAATYHAYGQGYTCYLGCECDDESLTTLYAGLLDKQAVRRATPTLPEGTALKFRESAHGPIAFLFNYKRHELKVDLGELELLSHEQGELLRGTVTLPPYASIVASVQTETAAAMR